MKNRKKGGMKWETQKGIRQEDKKTQLLQNITINNCLELTEFTYVYTIMYVHLH